MLYAQHAQISPFVLEASIFPFQRLCPSHLPAYFQSLDRFSELLPHVHPGQGAGVFIPQNLPAVRSTVSPHKLMEMAAAFACTCVSIARLAALNDGRKVTTHMHTKPQICGVGVLSSVTCVTRACANI